MTQTPNLFLKHTLLFSKRDGQQQPTSDTSSNPTTTTTPTKLALSIPEILEHILSFVCPQKRQGVARLVCKQWYSVCKVLRPVPFTWYLCLLDNENRTTKGLVHLAHSLMIRVSQPQPTPDRIASWAEMMGTLSTMIHERRQPKLRSLYLMFGVLGNLTIQLPQLPRLTFLTTLRIERDARWDLMHLFPILKSCPNLEELIVKPTKDSLLQIDRLSSVMTPIQENDLVNGDPLPPNRLRSCIVYNMMITLPALEVFLGASPGLLELVLVRSYYFNRSGNHAFQIQDRTPVIDLVALHCPNLKNFHLSIDGNSLNDREVTSILDRFPSLGEYSFSDRDARPALLGGLRTIVNRVTTLNLLTIQPRQQSVSGRLISLREILCTFEHLVHLRAPNMVYYHEDMDVNDIRGQMHIRWNHSRGRVRHAMSDNPTDQYIWACRGLQTLHMSIGCRQSDSNSPYEALIMFGLLSRMCPRLQELHLKRRLLDLSFQGGLCLLTRLQELERIKITTAYNQELDERALFWIRPRPSTKDQLNYPFLQFKTRMELRNWYQNVPGPSVEAGAGSRMIADAAKLGMNLSKVGYAEDLLEWMSDRYGGRLPTWPKLESFRIECMERSYVEDRAVRKMEAFITEARPDVDDVRLPFSPMDTFLTTLQLL